jgi:hypothetical protein
VRRFLRGGARTDRSFVHVSDRAGTNSSSGSRAGTNRGDDGDSCGTLQISGVDVPPIQLSWPGTHVESGSLVLHVIRPATQHDEEGDNGMGKNVVVKDDESFSRWSS